MALNKIQAGFKVYEVGSPIDSRFIVANIAALSNLNVYDGLIVYVKDLKKFVFYSSEAIADRDTVAARWYILDKDTHIAVDQLFKNSRATVSLGYIGLYEVATVFFGNSWESNPDAKEFTLDIIRDMKRRVEEWSDQYGYHFSIYSTPSESLTDRFCRLDTEKFGSIPDITDKEYYTIPSIMMSAKIQHLLKNWTLRKSTQKRVHQAALSTTASIQFFNKIQRPWKLCGTMHMTV